VGDYMKDDKFITESINLLNNRMEHVESHLKLLLVNNLVDDLKGACPKLETNIDSELLELVTGYGFKIESQQEINGAVLAYITIPENKKISTKELLRIDDEIETNITDIVLAFEFGSYKWHVKKGIGSKINIVLCV